MRYSALLLLAAACTPTVVDNPASSGEPTAARGPCDATKVQEFVGKPVSSVRSDAQRRSGAASVRVYRTGDALTMDYRPDRLNIETDDGGIVVKLGCG